MERHNMIEKMKRTKHIFKHSQLYDRILTLWPQEPASSQWSKNCSQLLKRELRKGMNKYRRQYEKTEN